MKTIIKALSAAVLLSPVLAACGDSTGPTVARADVEGVYTLSTLNFDPSGSLPQVDIRARMISQGVTPGLNLASDNSAQLYFRDPSTGSFITVNGTYSTTADGARIVWNKDSSYTLFLVPRTLTLKYTPADSSASGEKTLSFSGAVQEVSRDRLIQLVPEFQDEQLFDPVPGTLTMTFTGTSTVQ